jgi:hypothetical protein
MSDTLSNGSVFSVAGSYGSAIVMSAVSNATEASVSAVAHGLSAGDIVEVSSGWLDLDQRVVRVKTATTDAFVLEKIDTTDTVAHPAGTGVGSVRKILTWVQVAQVTDASSSGGDQNYATWTYLADGRERKKPTYKSAKTLVLKLNDDVNLACYPILQAADTDGLPRALRLKLPSPGAIFYNVYVSFDSEPVLSSNAPLNVSASFSQVARLVRYAS